MYEINKRLKTKKSKFSNSRNGARFNYNQYDISIVQGHGQN